ncbi:MAG: agmatinase [Desulfurococcales archaeon]|nr:agmatinase [Desulfurococcales archaeon]
MARYLDLYTVRGPVFAGIEKPREATYISILGAPMEATATYRAGQRRAPRAVRESSENIESNGYQVRGLYIEDVGLYDEGDISLPPGDPVESLERVRRVVAEIASEGRIPVVIGGEHTVTLGSYRGLVEAGLRPCIVVLDAHLDLRDEYMDVRLSHATVMKRVLELLGRSRMLFIGSRAYSREEAELAEGLDSIRVIESRDLALVGMANAASWAIEFLSDCRHLYLSIDMDVYDPAYAPGVGNPEPGGLGPAEVLGFIARIVDERLVGADLVEVTPDYDPSGVTSVLAAKTVQELLLAIEASRRRRPS